MRVRREVRRSKSVVADTGWNTGALPPHHAPFFRGTRHLAPGWAWRSLRLRSGDAPFVLVVLCRPGRAKWQAILARASEDGYAVVARFEDHGSHPGVHVHGDCTGAAPRPAAEGLDDLRRVPLAGAHHRRRFSWTREGFVAAAMRFFRIEASEEEDG